MITRRGLFRGTLGALFAPVVVRVAALFPHMPVYLGGKQIGGLLSFVPDAPSTGTVGGIDRSPSPLYSGYETLGIEPSDVLARGEFEWADNQSLDVRIKE